MNNTSHLVSPLERGKGGCQAPARGPSLERSVSLPGPALLVPWLVWRVTALTWNDELEGEVVLAGHQSPCKKTNEQ